MKANRRLRNRIKGWIPKEPLQSRRIGAINFRSHTTLILATTLLVFSVAVSYIVYSGILSSTQVVTPIVDSNPATTLGLKLHDFIYIKPDGSLWPNASANVLHVDGLVYSFTQNISNPILIQRDGAILDGAGYFLVGPGDREAIMISSQNSTVKNIKMVDWEAGIQVTGNNCTISNNYIRANIGMLLRANQLTVTGNCLVNVPTGKVKVDNPALEHWHYAVYIEPLNAQVYHNNFSNNQILNFTGAIRMSMATENTLTNNNIVNNSIGVNMRGCSTNLFSGNNFTQCTVFAISAFRSNGNSFYCNNFIDNDKQAVDACSYTLVPPEYSANIWDNGTIGNFWSNYPIDYLINPLPSKTWGAPYELYSNNTDHYPLTTPTFFMNKSNQLSPEVYK